MRINKDWLDCIAFLMMNGEDKNIKVPIATAFFVRIPDEKDLDISSVYVVTARHVVEEVGDETIYLRVNDVQGGCIDYSIKRADWYCSETEDVATYLFQPPVHFKDRNVRVKYRSINLEIFINQKHDFCAMRTTKGNFYVPVEIGHDVFFIGLFSQTFGDERNNPVVRFGNISRMPGEPITLPRWANSGSFSVKAYLVECRSWGGHSGSPAFWAFPRSVKRKLGEKDEMWAMDYVQGFLGLVSAHFDITRKAETSGDILGEIKVGINAGIAVITPAEAIRELLMREDLVRDRQKVANSLNNT